MSESIQITPSASAGAQPSKLSSLEAGNNPESTDDSAGFTAVFASYIESEPDAAEQQMVENLDDLISELLPQEMLQDGNMLPQDENMAMWQALMLVQPAENITTATVASSTPNSMQSIGLFNNQNKPVLNPQPLNPQQLQQDYFQSLSGQNKMPGTNDSQSGLIMNNVNAQLAAAHFTPDSAESLLLNMSEQPLQALGTNAGILQSLSAVGLGTATQAATTQTQMAPLNLGQNAWETNLGSRLQMLVGQNVQSAEIRLDPPELGALDIKIKVSNDVATVNIASAHTQVREALETAIPKLREMFEESGIALGDVNVRQESFSQQEKSAEDNDSGHFNQLADSDISEDSNIKTRKIISDNLLDMYA